MKLNIYEKKKIVKTYEADTYDLMFGTVEDVADAVQIDKLENGSDAEVIKLVGKLLLGSMDTVRGLMKDIFDGLTDEELKKTKVSEIAKVLIDVVMYTVTQLTNSFAGNEKNS